MSSSHVWLEWIFSGRRATGEKKRRLRSRLRICRHLKRVSWCNPSSWYDDGENAPPQESFNYGSKLPELVLLPLFCSDWRPLFNKRTSRGSQTELPANLIWLCQMSWNCFWSWQWQLFTSVRILNPPSGHCWLPQKSCHYSSSHYTAQKYRFNFHRTNMQTHAVLKNGCVLRMWGLVPEWWSWLSKQVDAGQFSTPEICLQKIKA